MATIEKQQKARRRSARPVRTTELRVILSPRKECQRLLICATSFLFLLTLSAAALFLQRQKDRKRFFWAGNFLCTQRTLVALIAIQHTSKYKPLDTK